MMGGVVVTWMNPQPALVAPGFNLHSLHQAWDTAARENSPFDGVLGFSQGAARAHHSLTHSSPLLWAPLCAMTPQLVVATTGALTAAIFLAFLQQQHRSPPPYLSSISATSLRRPLGHHRRARRPDAPPPRFAILCGGFRRPWPAEAGGYWPPPQSSPLPTPCACTTLPRHLALPARLDRTRRHASKAYAAARCAGLCTSSASGTRLWHRAARRSCWRPLLARPCTGTTSSASRRRWAAMLCRGTSPST